MKLPLQVTSRKCTLSQRAMETIRHKAEKLEQFSHRIMGCRVMVETPHRHKHQGVMYNVRLDITIPGSEIVVKREPHEDLFVAIRDAFDAARRQLQSLMRRKRGDIKTHSIPPHARIKQLYEDQGFGFLETDDGREIYFHSNSVVDSDFDDLQEGMVVRFAEAQGLNGPQASTVVPI